MLQGLQRMIYTTSKDGRLMFAFNLKACRQNLIANNSGVIVCARDEYQ